MRINACAYALIFSKFEYHICGWTHKALKWTKKAKYKTKALMKKIGMVNFNQMLSFFLSVSIYFASSFHTTSK